MVKYKFLYWQSSRTAPMNVIGVTTHLLATAVLLGCVLLLLQVPLNEELDCRVVNYHCFLLHYLSLQFDYTSMCSPCVLNPVLKKNYTGQVNSKVVGKRIAHIQVWRTRRGQIQSWPGRTAVSLRVRCWKICPALMLCPQFSLAISVVSLLFLLKQNKEVHTLFSRCEMGCLLSVDCTQFTEGKSGVTCVQEHVPRLSF